ncbi:hypothetical protein PG994_004237 [Apiospora phragmitis]|uniref:J domain-containing protein n=1 Tax=Apiospora phragmitis TaxID=2905665 RepID=A0ABR1VU31_9PEZI
MASSIEVTHTPDSMEGVESNATAPVGGTLAIENGTSGASSPPKDGKNHQSYVKPEDNKPNGNPGAPTHASGKDPLSSLDKARLVESYYVLIGLKADAYRLLQLPAYCDDTAEMKKAWWVLMQQLHSDHNKVEDADEYSGAVNAARDEIKDSKRRKLYDTTIKEEKKGRFKREDLTAYELLYVPRDATDAEIGHAYKMELDYFLEPADEIFRYWLETHTTALKIKHPARRTTKNMESCRRRGRTS